MNTDNCGKLRCSVCGALGYRNLIKHIKLKHSLQPKDYLELYPNDQVCTVECRKNFSKGGYNANKVMKESGLDFSERSRKARKTEISNNPNAYYVRNRKLMDIPGFKERATARIVNEAPPYRKYFHEYNGCSICFKSSWELTFAKFLEKNNYQYSYESLKVSYVDPTTGANRTYYPDFYLEDLNLLIEIKPKCYVEDPVVQSKAQSCIDLGYRFQFITEHELHDLSVDLLNG